MAGKERGHWGYLVEVIRVIVCDGKDEKIMSER